jgi:hypothetical protein
MSYSTPPFVISGLSGRRRALPDMVGGIRRGAREWYYKKIYIIYLLSRSSGLPRNRVQNHKRGRRGLYEENSNDLITSENDFSCNALWHMPVSFCCRHMATRPVRTEPKVAYAIV